MGTGRPAKIIDLQTPKNTKATIARAKMAEELVKTDNNELLSPPDDLINDEAKKEWNRVVPQLLKIDIIGNLDRAALIGYCNSLSKYNEATRALEKEEITVVEISKNGSKVKQNPLIAIQKSYAEEMRKFASIAGISMDARIRSGRKKVEKKEMEIEEKFGDI